MRALIHAQISLSDNVDADGVDEIARRLPHLRNWWPKRALGQKDEHIVSSTHVLLARIPTPDRKMAIDSFGYTLYHGLTKSWALVCFPDRAVVDIRVYNADPEDLKDACSAIVGDLRELEKVKSGEVPERLSLDLNKVNLLVQNRENYETKRSSIAELSQLRLASLLINEADMDDFVAFRPRGLSELPTLHTSEPVVLHNTSAAPNSIELQLTILFPKKIIVLQPDVAERAFEGVVIDSSKVRYAFRKRAPESIVASILIAVGIVALIIPMPSPAFNEVVDRICTAFIATGIFTLFGVVIISQKLRDSSLIDWQAL